MDANLIDKTTHYGGQKKRKKALKTNVVLQIPVWKTCMFIKWPTCDIVQNVRLAKMRKCYKTKLFLTVSCSCYIKKHAMKCEKVSLTAARDVFGVWSPTNFYKLFCKLWQTSKKISSSRSCGNCGIFQLNSLFVYFSKKKKCAKKFLFVEYFLLFSKIMNLFNR